MPLVTFDDRNIDGVYDSGTNENGSWIKFSNGVMIVWLFTEVYNQAINSAYTSGHYTGSRVMTYPQEFLTGTTPTVHCSMFRWGTSASWPFVGSITTTNCTLYGVDTVSRASGTRTQICYSAIGFWQ